MWSLGSIGEPRSIGEPGTVGTRGSSLCYVGEGGQPLVVGDSRMSCPSGQQAINMGHAHLSSAGNTVDNVNRVLHIHGFSQVDDTEALGTLLNQTRKRSHDSRTSSHIGDGSGSSSSKRRHTSVNKLVSKDVGEGAQPLVVGDSRSGCPTGQQTINMSHTRLVSAGNVVDNVISVLHTHAFTQADGIEVLGTLLNQALKRSNDSRTSCHIIDEKSVYAICVLLSNVGSSSDVHVSCETNLAAELVACSSRSRKRTRDVMSRTTVPNVGGNSSGVHVPCETNLAPKLVASSSRTQKHTRDVMSRITVPNIDGNSVSRRHRVSSGRRSLNITSSNNDYVFSMGSSDVHINGSGVRDNLTGPPLEYKHTGKCEYSCEHYGARFWDVPRFLQLYVYNTKNEVDNRMSYFGGESSDLRRDIMEGLIELLDNHNALMQLFRTAREKLLDSEVPPFKVRLFSVVDGYSKDMNMVGVPGAPFDEDRRLTMKAYYSYMLHDRNDIRNDYLSGIYDTIRREDSDGSDCGGRIILPQSLTGGPLYMYAHYLDALAMCRVHGNPSYFITFTCNVKWPKIVEYMVDFPRVTTADRADIVDSVFEMKIHEFLKYLRDVKPFGRIIAIVYTVEFQKRGLPHCHTLIWVHENSLIQSQEDIDNYISVELPSQQLDPEGHMIVTEFVIHGPCGKVCPAAACMKNTSTCTKHFSKEYCQNTYIDAAGFVHYRRRDTRIITTKQNVQLDNGYVVPYNLQLLKTFYAHINVEHCGWTTLIKYLFKYISKGTDKIAARVVKRILNLHIDPSELENYTKYELEACLHHCPRSLTDFGISLPPEDLMSVLRNRLLMEEKSYDRVVLAIEKDKLLRKLNNCQRNIFNLIIHVVTSKTQELNYVYGHGGTGKTFLWKTIIYALRAQGKIVLTVASLGIASLLLPSGQTAHSWFKLPLDLSDTSMCSVTKNTQLATLLKETDLIIWDESPMNDRQCFETLDRTLRDILDTPNRLFGGKPVMLGGDFRQTLTVKKRASRTEIIGSSIVESYLWRDRTLGEPNESDPENASWIQIPERFQIPDDENRLTKLIEFIYDEHTLLHPSAKDPQDKAIVCPKNNTAEVINAKVMSKLPGQSTTYISNDEVMPHGHDGAEVELLYPTKYLNTLNFGDIPPHELNLKIGTPIMLLRNINIVGGLCNITRMIIRQLLPKVIEAQMITKTRISQKTYIPRIPLTMNDPKLPFIFKRK
nr:DNA helicase [Tanacetum cinerariifolium]